MNSQQYLNQNQLAELAKDPKNRVFTYTHDSPTFKLDLVQKQECLEQIIKLYQEFRTQKYILTPQELKDRLDFLWINDEEFKTKLNQEKDIYQAQIQKVTQPWYALQVEWQKNEWNDKFYQQMHKTCPGKNSTWLDLWTRHNELYEKFMSQPTNEQAHQFVQTIIQDFQTIKQILQEQRPILQEWLNTFTQPLPLSTVTNFLVNYIWTDELSKNQMTLETHIHEARQQLTLVDKTEKPLLEQKLAQWKKDLKRTKMVTPEQAINWWSKVAQYNNQLAMKIKYWQTQQRMLEQGYIDFETLTAETKQFKDVNENLLTELRRAQSEEDLLTIARQIEETYHDEQLNHYLEQFLISEKTLTDREKYFTSMKIVLEKKYDQDLKFQRDPQENYYSEIKKAKEQWKARLARLKEFQKVHLTSEEVLGRLKVKQQEHQIFLQDQIKKWTTEPQELTNDEVNARIEHLKTYQHDFLLSHEIEHRLQFMKKQFKQLKHRQNGFEYQGHWVPGRKEVEEKNHSLPCMYREEFIALYTQMINDLEKTWKSQPQYMTEQERNQRIQYWMTKPKLLLNPLEIKKRTLGTQENLIKDQKEMYEFLLITKFELTETEAQARRQSLIEQPELPRELTDEEIQNRIMTDHPMVEKFATDHGKVFTSLTDRAQATPEHHKIIRYWFYLQKQVERHEITADEAHALMQDATIEKCKTGMTLEEYKAMENKEK